MAEYEPCAYQFQRLRATMTGFVILGRDTSMPVVVGLATSPLDE